MLLVSFSLLCYADTNSMWDTVIPHTDYKSITSYRDLFDTLEKLSVRVDPLQKGIRIVCPRFPGTLNLETGPSGMTFRDYLVFATPFMAYFDRDIVVLLYRPGRGVNRVAGIHGKCIDFDSGSPVTNALFLSTFTYPRVNYAVETNGDFVATIPYLIARGVLFVKYPCELMPPVAEFTVSASGYISQGFKIDVDCIGNNKPIIIRLRKKDRHELSRTNQGQGTLGYQPLK